MQKIVIFISVLLLPFTSVAEEEANICAGDLSANILASTPLSQFTIGDSDSDTINDETVVIDNKTGLMWARCTYGYQWDSGVASCTQVVSDDVAQVNWTEALVEASNTNSSDGTPGVGGYSDWRLPNIRELASLLERKCSGVAINNNVFPGSVGSFYWSSTHVYGSVTSPYSVRGVNFANGGSLDTLLSNQNVYLRLVRDMN